VRREERKSVGGVVLLRGGEEAINPWKPCLLAVISVKNNGDAVKLGNLVNMLGSSDGSGNGCLVGIIVDSLSSNELSTSLGESHHNGTSVLSSSFHTGVDRVSSNNVNSRDGISLLLGGIEEINKSISSDNTRLDRGRKLGECLF